jgi:hypothetical protein
MKKLAIIVLFFVCGCTVSKPVVNPPVKKIYKIVAVDKDGNRSDSIIVK